MAGDEALPVQELVDGQFVPVARFLKAQKSSAHSGNDLRFSTDHPAPRIWRGKVRDCKRAAIRAKDITQLGTGHIGTLTRNQDLKAL